MLVWTVCNAQIVVADPSWRPCFEILSLVNFTLLIIKSLYVHVQTSCANKLVQVSLSGPWLDWDTGRGGGRGQGRLGPLTIQNPILHSLSLALDGEIEKSRVPNAHLVFKFFSCVCFVFNWLRDCHCLRKRERQILAILGSTSLHRRIKR